MMLSIVHRALPIALLAAIALTSTSHLEGYTLSGRKWASSTVRYYVNPKSNWVSQSAATSAIQQAAAAWSEQTNANVALLYAGATSGSSLLLNYKNEVFFRNASNGSAVAETHYWYNSANQLIDTDIVVYEGAYRFFVGSGCSDGVYVENVVIHEFGHALGLQHSSVSGATMQPSMPGLCDRSQLSLAADDIAGIEKNYPPLSGSNNTAPSVTISSPANNISVSETSSIMFSGSASDSQDGNLTATLRWTSNLVGQIGSGGSFSRALPAGVHLITAGASDTTGLVGSQAVTLVVTAASPPPLPPPPPSPPRRRHHPHRRRRHLHRLASRLRQRRPRRPQESHQLPPICKARQWGVT